MAIRVDCPKCGKAFSAPDAAAGKRGRCSGCGEVVEIPAVVAASPVDSGLFGSIVDEAVTVPPAPSPPPKIDLIQSVALGQGPRVVPATKELTMKVPAQGVTRIQGYAIIVILLAGLGVPFFGSLRPAPRWHYKIEALSDLTFEDDIKKLGDEGWELVFARRASSSLRDGMAYEMIFKRPQ